MANAAGRLIGSLLSGIIFQLFGLIKCLRVSAGIVLVAGGFSMLLLLKELRTFMPQL